MNPTLEMLCAVQWHLDGDPAPDERERLRRIRSYLRRRLDRPSRYLPRGNPDR